MSELNGPEWAPEQIWVVYEKDIMDYMASAPDSSSVKVLLVDFEISGVLLYQ